MAKKTAKTAKKKTAKKAAKKKTAKKSIKKTAKKKTAKKKSSAGDATKGLAGMVKCEQLPAKSKLACYTVPELAEHCGVHQKTVLNWIKRGQIEAKLKEDYRGYLIPKKGFKQPERYARV